MQGYNDCGVNTCATGNHLAWDMPCNWGKQHSAVLRSAIANAIRQKHVPQPKTRTELDGALHNRVPGGTGPAPPRAKGGPGPVATRAAGGTDQRHKRPIGNPGQVEPPSKKPTLQRTQATAGGAMGHQQPKCNICNEPDDVQQCTKCHKHHTHHCCCIKLYARLTEGGDLKQKHRLCDQCTWDRASHEQAADGNRTAKPMWI